MSRNSFWCCNKIIHCDITTTIKLLNETFQKYWYPYQHIAIDESIIGFKGNYTFYVY